MAEERAKRKLSAILSADVKGYSRLMGEDEVGTVRTLKDYRDLMSKLIKEYRGRVVDSPGDNVLADFASVVDALECSIEIQKLLRTKNDALPDNRKMEFRIGVNLGDVIEDEDRRVYGDGVNIAARIEGLAEPGGISVSGTAFDQVKNKLSVGYQYLGKQTVKNIPDPVRAYKVLMEQEAAGKVIGEKEPNQTKWGWKAVAAVAVLVLVAGGLLWNFYLRAPKIEPASKEKMALPLPDKPSIAVLPFVNMSGDPKEDYFSDGLTEQIITSLSMIPRLFVIARNSTFVYRGKAVKVQTVAEEQGVRYVLEGGVQKSQDRVRITVQLIDAIKGHHLWSERYDRELKDLFALQDEIVRQIMTAVQVELTEGQLASAIAGSTSNLKALECFWRALEYSNRWSREDNAAARQWAEKAIEHDPNFARAFALLGTTHLMEATQFGGTSPAQSIKQAEGYAHKAISMNVASAQALMSGIRRIQGRWDEAVEYGEKALVLNPNDPRMMLSLALTVHYLGRFDESIALTKRAMRMCPYYPAIYLSVLAPSYVIAGRYQEAVEACEQMLDRSRKGEINPLFAHIFLAEAYVGLDQLDKAREQAEEVLKIDPKFSLESEKRLTAFKDPAIGERRLAALRKAGLPNKPPLPLPDKLSIAVLPFVNMSEDKSQEYFCDGIAEEVINALARVPQVYVIARNSSFTYKGKAVDVKQVGREMGVKYVLEGSARREESRVRITAQLVDATTGSHVFSERYDRELKDIFALQDDITMRILTAIQVTLTEGQQARIHGKGTKVLEAYLGTLEVRELAIRLNKEDNALAREKCEEVLALDPQYARAWELLSTIYLMDFQWGIEPEQSLRKAHEAAQKAVSLDETLGSPHMQLGFLYAFTRRYEEGIAESERAVQLDPGSANVHANFGRVLEIAGQPKEALGHIEKAIRMNPIPPAWYWQHLGFAHMQLEQYDDAVVAFKRALAVAPKHRHVLVGLISTYSLMGRMEEAKAVAQDLLRADPRYSPGKARLFHKDEAFNKRFAEGIEKAGLLKDASAN